MWSTLDVNTEPLPGYRLIRRLGRGGFGEVWEADAPGGLRKAVKVVPLKRNGSGSDASELDGLRVMRSLRHPYLLSIERFEIVDEHLIIVMELAEQSLADRFADYIRDGRPGIPRDELIGYIREIAEVLDVMNWTHGLQHLDIKPENIFVCSGHIKVGDFGLVRPGNTNVDVNAVALSPPYAAPELFDGRIEQTADQYSLAVTYQELLTGKRPFQAKDVRGLLYQHAMGRPDLSVLSQHDQKIVSRAIHRDPRQRHPSCRDFVDALARVGLGETNSIRRTRSADRRGLLVTREVRPQPMQPKARRVTRHHVPTGTTTAGLGMTRTQAFTTRTGESSNEEWRDSVAALLPTELFAEKLRGFISEHKAKIVESTEEQILLSILDKKWLGLRSSKGWHIQVESCCLNGQSGYRAIDIRIWNDSPKIDGEQRRRTGGQLLQSLKSWLMVVQSGSSPRGPHARSKLLA
ncbi:Serine/threonine-protein kinase PknF [Planctomycetes bacterium Pan216]|uniref:Serine/threonine-protein kinase PknF n=1 Tax=Kolteria novifilia TaxID=2527975 RepID=A0A518B3M2_9BACT|nr:Serine/threonine-protein kinase PknF [Planctomycetes bacterium Pan216]